MQDKEPKMVIHECLRVRGEAIECRECPVKIEGYDQEFYLIIAEKAGFLRKEGLDDALQDIIDDFVWRVIKKVHSFEARWNPIYNKKASFKTWATAIFTNTYRDYVKKRKTVSTDSTDNEPVIKEDLTEELKKRWNKLSDQERDEIDALASPEERENKFLLEAHRKKILEHKYMSEKHPHSSHGPVVLHPFYEHQPAAEHRDTEDLREHLKKLSPDESAFLLNDAAMKEQGLSQKDMAQRMGLSVDAYKQRKCRALKKLIENKHDGK